MSRVKSSSPGPQIANRGNWLGPISLQLLLIAVGLLMIQSIGAANIDSPNALVRGVFSIHLLSIDQSVSLFVAVVALMFTRKQIAEQFRPFMVYEGLINPKTNSVLGQDESKQSFGISLKNVGNGVAYINKSSFELKFMGTELTSDIGFEKVVECLKGQGLMLERNYYLVELGSGYAFANNCDSGLLVFEIVRSSWDLIETFNLTIEFESGMGDVYKKTIYLVPKNRELRFPPTVGSNCEN